MATVGEQGLAEIAKWVEVVDAFMIKAGGMYQHAHARDHGLVQAVSIMLAKGAGWRQLGAGHFSAAYLTNLLDSDGREIVVKIGFKPQADSAMAYLQWARQHQDLPAVPVVHSLNAARHRDGVWYCVTRRYESRAVEYERDFCILAEKAVRINTWSGKAYGSGGERPIFEHQQPDHLKPALETCRAIHNWFRNAASFDLHHENIMWDGDLPIINDPISFKSARAMQQEVQHDSTDHYPARLDMERAAQRRHDLAAVIRAGLPRGTSACKSARDAHPVGVRPKGHRIRLRNYRLILTPSVQPKRQHWWHAIKENLA